jgi:SAM-dependent methyltransferase
MNPTEFNEWFDTHYYHLLYKHRDHDEAARFIDRLIEHLHPKQGCSMLDIACGKGRHALQLSEKGFNVTGIDLSENSIESAQLLSNVNLHFFVHDMRLPIPVEPVDYAFNFFTSFGYFETVQEDEQAIASMADSIKEGGWLVMDYVNMVRTEKELVPHTEQTIEGIHFISERSIGDRFIHKQIKVVDPAMSSPFFYEERVARYRVNDFEKMFVKTGLTLHAVLGNEYLDAFDPEDSSRLILIAQKK